MTAVSVLGAVDVAEIEDYPVARDVRLDSHSWIPWYRQRWLNSSMRLMGRPECRALYRDLIDMAFDHTPVGTLPDDVAQLARMCQVAESDFRGLCALEYGPLHKWRPCLSEGERRLMHPVVLDTVLEALSRRADNRARNEAANTRKRLQRLRVAVGAYSVELAQNDQAIRWMDEWLVKQEVGQRSAAWVERAMAAWSERMLDRGLRAR